MKITNFNLQINFKNGTANHRIPTHKLNIAIILNAFSAPFSPSNHPTHPTLPYNHQ